MDTLLVGVVVAMAALYAGRRMYRQYTAARQGRGGCGCGGATDGCASSKGGCSPALDDEGVGGCAGCPQTSTCGHIEAAPRDMPSKPS